MYMYMYIITRMMLSLHHNTVITSPHQLLQTVGSVDCMQCYWHWDRANDSLYFDDLEECSTEASLREGGRERRGERGERQKIEGG